MTQADYDAAMDGLPDDPSPTWIDDIGYLCIMLIVIFVGPAVAAGMS